MAQKFGLAVRISEFTRGVNAMRAPELQGARLGDMAFRMPQGKGAKRKGLAAPAAADAAAGAVETGGDAAGPSRSRSHSHGVTFRAVGGGGNGGGGTDSAHPTPHMVRCACALLLRLVRRFTWRSSLAQLTFQPVSPADRNHLLDATNPA